MKLLRLPQFMAINHKTRWTFSFSTFKVNITSLEDIYLKNNFSIFKKFSSVKIYSFVWDIEEWWPVSRPHSPLMAPYYKMTRSHKVSSNILNSTDSHLIPVTHSPPSLPSLSPLSLLPTQKYLFKVNSWRHTGTVQTCCMLSLDKDHLRFLRMRHFNVIMNWLDKFLNSPDQTELLSLVTTQPDYFEPHQRSQYSV